MHYVLHTVGETFHLIFGMVRSQWDLCQQIFQIINFTRGYFRPRVFYFHRVRLLFIHYVLYTVGETFHLIFGMVRSQWDLCQQIFQIIKIQPFIGCVILGFIAKFFDKIFAFLRPLLYTSSGVKNA